MSITPSTQQKELYLQEVLETTSIECYDVCAEGMWSDYPTLKDKFGNVIQSLTMSFRPIDSAKEWDVTISLKRKRSGNPEVYGDDTEVHTLEIEYNDEEGEQHKYMTQGFTHGLRQFFLDYEDGEEAEAIMRVIPGGREKWPQRCLQLVLDNVEELGFSE